MPRLVGRRRTTLEAWAPYSACGFRTGFRVRTEFIGPFAQKAVITNTAATSTPQSVRSETGEVPSSTAPSRSPFDRPWPCLLATTFL